MVCMIGVWVPSSLLSNGYWGKSGAGVKLTTHLLLVPRSRTRGAITPLPQNAFMAWCLVKHRELTLLCFIYNWMSSFYATDTSNEKSHPSKLKLTANNWHCINHQAILTLWVLCLLVNMTQKNIMTYNLWIHPVSFSLNSITGLRKCG
jgi:hypothetical protein